MQGFLTWLLQQNSAGLDSIISVSLTLFFIGIYVVPLFFVVLDIYKEYYINSRKLFWTMIVLASLFLPVFLIMYFNHKKLKSGIANSDKEIDLLIASNNLVECYKCEHLNKKEGKYCTNCGATLYYYCENCSHPFPRSMNFCGECGFTYNKQTTPSPKANKFLNAIGYKIPQLLEK